jgi:cell division transport system ATP-binding protein
VSFVIDKGEFVFVVGASGSGKSTIIRLLLKELEPTSGRIIVAGRDLGRLRGSKVPQLRRNLGCVFQDFKLLPNRTASENVAYALKVQGESGSSIRRKVPDVLNMVGLAHKMGSYPDELSGGEQQRTAIARALCAEPDLLLADEPTGNLDEESARRIVELMVRAHEGGATVMVATHDPQLLRAVPGRQIVLRAGRVVNGEASGG